MESHREQHLPHKNMGRSWGTQDSRPYLDHSEQQADADGEEHSNEQEAGEQVGCKARAEAEAKSGWVLGTRTRELLVWGHECEQ